jgi:AraC-like DNA-binding protein/ligand-binding sensor protein
VFKGALSMAEASHTGQSKQDKQLINMLLRSRLFRDYETVFTKATGLPLTLRPVEFWQLAHHGKKHENPFCALLAERPATLAVCLEAHQNMIEHTGLLPHTVTCPFGLTETAVPVKLGTRVIGYLRIGQVLRHAPAKSDESKVVRELKRHAAPFTHELRKAWEKNPLIYPDRYNAIVRLLSFFAEQLSGLANQLVIESQNIEPPLVIKAREYIEKHKTEELSLADVAKAAGSSVFHFCKVFHKATGLKFTDYVARVRLEDARNRLLNPNLRVSEIAYDVGFQSLTQFNRAFKRVFGQSPTRFRARLSSGKRSGKVA